MWSVIKKDLLLEWRNKDALIAMTAFTVLVFLLFSFAVDSRPALLSEIASGAMWIAYLFAGAMGFNRLAQNERENNAFYTILLSPIDRSAVYFAKTIVNALLLILVELISLPVLVVFFNVDVWKLGLLLPLVLLIGTLGMAATGTLFSAMLVNIRMKDVMMPLLSFPLLSPLLIALVTLTRAVLAGHALPALWLRVAVTYDLLFVAAGMILYEYLLEE